MKCNSIIKSNKVLIHATPRTNLKNIMFRERSQMQKNTYCMVPFTQNYSPQKANLEEEKIVFFCNLSVNGHKGSFGADLLQNGLVGSPCSPRDSQESSPTPSSKASILRCSAFFTVQLSHPYMTTGKTIALTRQTFVGKVMSLLLNMLSRLVITFLPRSKRLLISWLQSPSAVKGTHGHTKQTWLPKGKQRGNKLGGWD